MLSAVCYANSVRPSVTRVYCIKTALCIIEIISRSDRPIILVFRYQGSLRKSEGVIGRGSGGQRGPAPRTPLAPSNTSKGAS